jgi:hypothetical protein
MTAYAKLQEGLAQADAGRLNLTSKMRRRAAAEIAEHEVVQTGLRELAACMPPARLLKMLQAMALLLQQHAESAEAVQEFFEDAGIAV